MKKLLSLTLAFSMMLAVFLTGCKNPVEILVEGKTYSNQIGTYDEMTLTESVAVYDKDIFYRNEEVKMGADPAILYVEDETNVEDYGKYFLFGTMGLGVYNCYSSYDLVSWKPDNPVYIYESNSWEHADTYAPEFLWEKDASREKYGVELDAPGTGVYFMFYSSAVAPSYTVSTDITLNDYLGLAVSATPQGPYKMWTGVETGAVIGGIDYGTAEAYAKYTVYADMADELDSYAEDNYVARKGNKVDIDDWWFNPAAARASLNFMYENRANAGEIIDGTYVPESSKNLDHDGSKSDFGCFDPEPFIDPVTGDKYLFFVRTGNGLSDSYGSAYTNSSTYGVKMKDNDWSQIDYSTLTRVTRCKKTFVNDGSAEDYNTQAAGFDATKYPAGVKETTTFTLEDSTTENNFGTGLNEGPQVIYNADSGLYYLSVSTGAYIINTYAVIQAVAYSPLGPYRKLELDEGGVLVTSAHGASSDIVTGPGHHQIIDVGEEQAVLYHRHRNMAYSGANRGAAIDRMIWVKNENGLLILHLNGPTTNIQPKFYATGSTEYDIISDEAEISIKGDDYNDASLLNDGVVAVHDEFYGSHIKEFEFTSEDIEITLEFDDYRPIKALMIYNSYNYDKAYEKIKRIEMDAVKDGEEFTAVIEDLLFPWDLGEQALGGLMRAGTAATAVFNELDVKEIRITIENYNLVDGFSGVTAVSEIYVLGRPNE